MPHRLDRLGIAADGRDVGVRHEFKTDPQARGGGEIAECEPIVGEAALVGIGRAGDEIARVKMRGRLDTGRTIADFAIRLEPKELNVEDPDAALAEPPPGLAKTLRWPKTGKSASPSSTG